MQEDAVHEETTAQGDAEEGNPAEVVESTAATVDEAPQDPAPKVDELKIVVIYRGTVGTVGIQKPDSDPVFSRIEGDLPEVISNIPRLIDEARAVWETHPKYPKADLPAPPAPTPRPASARPASSPPPAKKNQPAFF